MNASTHDLLLVGGGATSLRAATANGDVNPKLNITFISKIYLMRSHTIYAEAAAGGVVRAASERKTQESHHKRMR